MPVISFAQAMAWDKLGRGIPANHGETTDMRRNTIYQRPKHRLAPRRFEVLEPRLALALTATDDAYSVGRDQTLEFSEIATLIPLGSTWYYHSPCSNEQDPSLTDPDFYETWHTQLSQPANYDGPRFWSSPSPLGHQLQVYGVSTVVHRCASVATTAYFTRTFEFDGDPQLVRDILADVLLEDGAFFYLNGQPVGQHNMGSAPDHFGQHAASNQEPDELIFTMKLANALVRGTNVLAASVYNSNVNSGDFGFDLGLRVRTRVGSVLENDATDSGMLHVVGVQDVPVADAAVAAATMHGTVTIRPDGIFNYAPYAGFVGRDRFTYDVRDETGDAATATVTIDVTSPDDFYSTRMNEPFSTIEIVPLVERASTWSYYVRNGGVDPASSDPDFFDTWYTQSSNPGSYDGPAFVSSEPGPFAYGDVDCCTPGSTLPVVPRTGSRHAAYFVRDFTFAETPPGDAFLVVNLLVDDGAFVSQRRGVRPRQFLRVGRRQCFRRAESDVRGRLPILSVCCAVAGGD